VVLLVQGPVRSGGKSDSSTVALTSLNSQSLVLSLLLPLSLILPESLFPPEGTCVLDSPLPSRSSFGHLLSWQ
jgi:hypothetical protein